MPRDIRILEYKNILKKTKLYQGLHQNNQTNLCRVVFDEIWVSRICLLLKTINVLLLVKSFGEQLYLDF